MFKIIYQTADDLWTYMWKARPYTKTRERSTAFESFDGYI